MAAQTESRKAFDAAVQHVKTATDLKATNEDKLKFYALFKQATSGDCVAAAEPSRFSVVAHAKWKAWNDLRGMQATSAMTEYVATVRSLDPAFARATAAASKSSEQAQQAACAPAAPATDATVRQEPKATKPSVAATKASVAATKPNSPSQGPSPFLMSVLFCLGVAGVGVVGFLVTTLSNQALFFLGLVFAGLAGVVGCFAQLLDSNGLIALYPAIMQRILLDRTLVEVILEGTIMQRIKDVIAEVYPILYCKTHEDRLAVLENMSERTRRVMTTRGVVNLLPEWQQRVTLSRDEYARQKAKLASEATAFRPALDAATEGKTKRSPTQAELDAQRALAGVLFRRSMQDRAAKFIVDAVNPQFCKGASIALGLSLIVQLRVSERARSAVFNFVRSTLLSGSSVGAILFACLALLHQVARRYHRHRQALLEADAPSHHHGAAKQLDSR